MVEKRKPGQKYPERYIKNQIILKLCEKDETETSEIMDYLKERFGIRDTKGIREHIKTLETEKLIKKESAGLGHPDYLHIDTNPGVFSVLLDRFAKTEFEDELLDTEYCIRACLCDKANFKIFCNWNNSRRNVLIGKIRNLTIKNSEFWTRLDIEPAADIEINSFRGIIAAICPQFIDPEQLDAAVVQAYQADNPTYNPYLCPISM